MKETSWVSCPICHNKTRIKIRIDTELRNFPLFCPKCKQETLIHVKQLNISVIREPDRMYPNRRRRQLSPNRVDLCLHGVRHFRIRLTRHLPQGHDGHELARERRLSP